MMSSKDKDKKDFIAIDISPDRRRFSDCCNAEIIGKQCPKCGRYFDDEKAGMHEIQLRGMDGKTAHTAKADAIAVSMIDDTPKREDKMPKLYKEMQNRGVKILSWTDTGI